MTDTKFGPLESLVGRTFERANFAESRLRIIAVDGHGRIAADCMGKVGVWSECDVCDFLSGAVEVKDGQG